MNSPEYDGLEIWQNTIESLDLSGLPEPPPDRELPLTNDEQARMVWDLAGIENFGYQDYLPEQPDFGPYHIKSPEQLKPGMIVTAIIAKKFMYEMVIVRTDQQLSEQGALGFEYIYLDEWRDPVERRSLFAYPGYYEDHGLVPDSSGNWHPFNHLCLTGESLSQRELASLTRRLR